MKRSIRSTRRGLFSLGVWLASGLAIAQTTPSRRGLDRLERSDSRPIAGDFQGNAKAGFRFVPADGSAPIAINGPAEIALGGEGPSPASGVPTVQVVLGLGQWISGQLVRLDDRSIRLAEGPGGRPVEIDRRGALTLRQRPGEALVMIDGFESLDAARWSQQVGNPVLDASARLAGDRSLKIAADGSAITTTLPDPVAQGRLELAFLDTAAVVPGAQWFVDLLFRGERGPESLRAVLGWSEESLAVQSSGGPALAVQRLSRKAGWHRLEVRFGPEAAEMSVDGDALAHGKGPTGPLIEIRIGSSLTGIKPVDSTSAHIDELRLVRLATLTPPGEADPSQDEVRLIEGDQLFGQIKEADAAHLVAEVLARPVSLSWSEVASLSFRRQAHASRVVEGLLVKLEWRSAPGKDSRDLDRAEGALVAADDRAFTLETPYAGTLVIPRDRLRRMVVEGFGRSLVVDPTAHHLGDEVSKAPELLDPPQPEGGVLERKFTLDKGPGIGEVGNVVLDVVQVVGEANGLQFSQLIREGQLRTKVWLNGTEFDYLNRHVATRNETPERIRLPIPTGLLKPGENVLRIVQSGTTNDPTYLDDLGILGIAVEIVSRPPAGIKP